MLNRLTVGQHLGVKIIILLTIVDSICVVVTLWLDSRVKIL